MTFLWVVNFDYPTRLHHGSTLRHVNYARELQAMGHTVYFVVQFDPRYLELSREWFRGLREQHVISDFFELSYNPSSWRLRLASLTLHPSLANRTLRSFQTETTREVKALIARLQANALILSDRQCWFLADTLQPLEPVLIDVCDCASLYMARDIRRRLRERRFGEVRTMLRRFLYTVSEDRYYARRGNVAMVVSQVDRQALTRISGPSSHVVTLLNGVSFPPPHPAVEKVRNRLIFSGNMNFPPNHDAAVWFLDSVLPLVQKQVPDVQLVLAGANPLPSLQQRAGSNVVVTGYVEDLNDEIARSALYVVPMVSGGGFKNKVVEAIVNRTYVVATSMAVEFLDPETRDLIAVADSPQKMADTIVALLRDPGACASRLSSLYDRVSHDFTWSHRAGELLAITRAPNRR
jgi:glycosyltransferase involved in cell wall biosynthesis